MKFSTAHQNLLVAAQAAQQAVDLRLQQPSTILTQEMRELNIEFQQEVARFALRHRLKGQELEAFEQRLQAFKESIKFLVKEEERLHAIQTPVATRQMKPSAIWEQVAQIDMQISYAWQWYQSDRTLAPRIPALTPLIHDATLLVRLRTHICKDIYRIRNTYEAHAWGILPPPHLSNEQCDILGTYLVYLGMIHHDLVALGRQYRKQLKQVVGLLARVEEALGEWRGLLKQMGSERSAAEAHDCYQRFIEIYRQPEIKYEVLLAGYTQTSETIQQSFQQVFLRRAQAVGTRQGTLKYKKGLHRIIKVRFTERNSPH